MSDKSEKLQFKSGDVVRLKSGGPKMTVMDIDGHGNHLDVVTCTWFVDGEYKPGKFRMCMLEAGDACK